MTNENLLLQESVVVSEKLALAYKDVAEKKDTKLAEQEIFQTEVQSFRACSAKMRALLEKLALCKFRPKTFLACEKCAPNNACSARIVKIARPLIA